ncbi:hypothetical protein [Roseimaritima sediminicola]|uniref:hypothetical protein n=1 Tax=Roseimaritima sediminicola TaxID=2662066 RepID=UPI0012984104|nr:hypothetical protein [Roseimaritima sediminicola]
MADSTAIRYTLNRRQRLIPHLHIWGYFFTPFIIILVAFFTSRMIAMTISFDPMGMVVFGLLAVSVSYLFRGLFIGLIDVLLYPRREMDITIEDKAMGIMLGSQRYYLFLDGIISISRFCHDVWTVQHWNGSVVHIAADAIPDRQLQHMRDMMRRGQTPEGVAEAIERGKTIAQISASERKAEP